METLDGSDRAVTLSVVIACYDGAATLGEQLDALAGQPCPVGWEVIVADNGSTDASVAVARSYTDRLPLRVVDAADRRGPAHARNVGVRAARGEWIAFCDTDDVVADDWLAQVCTALAEVPFAAGRVDLRRLNSPRVARSRTMAQQEGLQPGSDNRLGLPYAGAGNMALHADVFRDVGGFDEGLRCLEDTDLCWRIQLAGTPLVYRPGMLLHTRLRARWRGIFTQGYGYARGFSALEERYGSLVPSPGPADAPEAAAAPAPVDAAAATIGAAETGSGTAGPASGLVARAARVGRVLLGVRSLRGLVWQCGWYAGRAAGRLPGRSPLPPTARPARSAARPAGMAR